jgi:hypothetical protein
LEVQAVAGVSPAGPGVSHGNRCVQQPLLLKLKDSLGVVPMDYVTEASKPNSRVDVSEVENAISIGGSDCLLEHHQEVIDARLPRAVRPEKDS